MSNTIKGVGLGILVATGYTGACLVADNFIAVRAILALSALVGIVWLVADTYVNHKEVRQ